MDDWKTSLVLSDLQAACNALGGWDEGVYVKENDCVESLKDLMRYLRRDDESYGIRRALGRINVIKTDLIPLVRFYHKDVELFEIATKLIVNLTTPVVLLYKEELPIEKNARNIYMTLEATLCSYKDAFLEKEIWSALAEKLEHFMNLNYHERTEEDTEAMTRILTILRNVLHPIHREELNLKTDGDVSSHDRLLWALHLAGMDDLIIYMCTARMEQSHTLYVVEILRLMLREQEASYLASAGTQRPQEEVKKEGEQLAKLREIERRRKNLELKAVMHNRFARFSSTYQVCNVKSLGDDTKELIVVGDPAKVLQSINNMDFDQKKKFRARAKNRRPEECASVKRRTTLNIRIFLKDFCSDLLCSSFNALLPQARRAMTRAGDTGDEGHYFWLLDFFLEFNRLTGFDIALVSEAISKETFHFVQTQMEKCHEMMVTDKRRIHLWMRRLHLNLKTFRQLLMTVSAMKHHKDPQVIEASKVLQQHLFYLPEYRDIALHLLLNFNDSVAPVTFLRDLATTVHIYLRMLQAYCGNSKLKVMDIKKRTISKPKPPAFADLTEEQLDHKWLELSRQLTTLLDGQNQEFSYDINLVLEGFHQYEKAFQLQVCKHKIADLLRLGSPSEAVGLLRASRIHFSDESCFGEASIPIEAEFMLLRSFFYAENFGSIDLENEHLNHDDEEIDRMQDFDFEDFLKRFANPKVIKVYGILLSHYTTNSAEVNKVCVKMLHRIAFDLKMSAMLFQAQIFVVFDKILDDYSITPDVKELRELARFAKYIVQQFVEIAKVNDLAIVELLFWKTSAEANQIQYGYNDADKSKTQPWTAEEDLELKRLFEENNDNIQPGQDIIEIIQKEFSNKLRTRRQIITHLRIMGLIEKGTRFKSSSSSTTSIQPWSGEEEQELQELYQTFATSVNPLAQIMLNMTVKRPKFRVIEKLIELGIIHDRSEVRKRRVRKNGEVVLPRSISKRQTGEGNPTCISKEFISSSDESSTEDETHDVNQEVTNEITRENANFLETIKNNHNMYENNGKKGKRQKKQKLPKQKRNATYKVEKVVNTEELKELLRKAVEHRQAAIDWVLESIQEALEEWKDEQNEAVPLVPLVGAEYESLEDKEFCKLLSTFSFVPPQEGTEQYWRIAGDLSRNMLQSRLNVLKKATEGHFEDGIVVCTGEEITSVDSCLEQSTGESDDSEQESANNDSSDEDHDAKQSPQQTKEANSFRLIEQTEIPGSSKDVIGHHDDKEESSIDEAREFAMHSYDKSLEDSQGTKRNYSSDSSSPRRSAKKRRVAIESDSDDESETERSQPLAEPFLEGLNTEQINQLSPVKRNRKTAIIESDESSH